MTAPAVAPDHHRPSLYPITPPGPIPAPPAGARLMGTWLVSEASIARKDPVQHFVPDSDAEAFCAGVSNLIPYAEARPCYRCLHALIKEGLLRVSWT